MTNQRRMPHHNAIGQFDATIRTKCDGFLSILHSKALLRRFAHRSIRRHRSIHCAQIHRVRAMHASRLILHRFVFRPRFSHFAHEMQAKLAIPSRFQCNCRVFEARCGANISSRNRRLRAQCAPRARARLDVSTPKSIHTPSPCDMDQRLDD